MQSEQECRGCGAVKDGEGVQECLGVEFGEGVGRRWGVGGDVSGGCSREGSGVDRTVSGQHGTSEVCLVQSS